MNTIYNLNIQRTERNNGKCINESGVGSTCSGSVEGSSLIFSSDIGSVIVIGDSNDFHLN